MSDDPSPDDPALASPDHADDPMRSEPALASPLAPWHLGEYLRGMDAKLGRIEAEVRRVNERLDRVEPFLPLLESWAAARRRLTSILGGRHA